MILLDSNILIYAYAESSPYHSETVKWLDARLAGPVPVGVPWPCIVTFVRLASNPAVIKPQVSPVEVWEAVQSLLATPVVWIPQPTERHAEILGSMMKYVKRPDHVMDAHLAALALEHNLTLCTADGDFARFPGLRWQNPLQP